MAQVVKATKPEFRVALNVANPESNSWYCPATGVNLFLGTPISEDLSMFDEEDLEAVYRGIKAGLLIVAVGTLPEGFNKNEVSRYGSPRKRTPIELSDEMDKAISHHKSLFTK